jgi:regulatory protein
LTPIASLHRGRLLICRVARTLDQMRSPAKITDEKALYTAALGALARRAHSVFEMRTFLERRAAEPEAARAVMARLREQRLLDDARYAIEFARLRVRTRGQGPYRITRELRARGVADQNIETAVAEAFAETDEAALVRRVIDRRLRALRGPWDARRAASVYRSLLRGGFDANLIRRELSKAGRTLTADIELPAMDAGEEVS